jgi:2-dehydro-3-deoxyphosphogluconate aldolase/(4S)-4-hydroxy-2-oxoglutarate aldolase
MLAGIGTVLRPDQVTEVIDAGGDFAVSPGMNPRVVEKAISAGLPFAPGICTPSDIERALEFDRKLLKFFPAEPSGGLNYLRTIAAPYAHLGVKYLPLGGVTTVNMENYIREPMVGGIGGSWLASREVIQKKHWSQITAAASGAIEIREQVRRRKV